MERTIKLSTKNGYIFNEDTKKLESYEFISATFTLCPSEEIVYVCKVGGVERNINTMSIDVYENEDMYRRGVMMDDTRHYVNDDVLPTGNTECYTWLYVNGEAKRVEAEDIAIRFADGQMSTEVKCYASRDEVYKYHDLVVVEADGTERVSKCIANLMALTEEQEAIVSQLRELLRQAHESGLRLEFGIEESALSVYNASEVELYSVYYSEGEDNGWTDVTDLGHIISLHGCYHNDEERVFFTKRK